MAKRGGVRVERKGRERLLRIDDTYASSYEPGKIATGSVWDALACGLLALPEARRRDVLILGLGGGSAARILRALAPELRIVAVELRQDVVDAAMKHFDLGELDLEVVVGDAREVARDLDERFDLVIEDVFIGSGRDAYKPDGFPFPALEHAKARVRPGGILATNTLDEAPEIRRAMLQLFPSVLEVSLEDFDNRVFLGSVKPLSAADLRRAVAKDLSLSPSLTQLHFRTERSS